MGRKMASDRTGTVKRKTKETDVQVSLDLDGGGTYSVETGIPFFNHLLELFARHGGFGLKIAAGGDLDVDFHHLVEDTGICLGEAFRKAIGTMGGIRRYGQALVPMDEALVRSVIDISGRPYLCYQVTVENPMVVHFNAQLAEEYFRAFAHNANVTLHIDSIRGRNTHHILEAVYKSFGVALKSAVEIVSPEDEIPSTKGVL
jgi:imidazoleglycerol-phosphate dehydratase